LIPFFRLVCRVAWSGLRVVSLTDAWATRRMFVCVRLRAALTAPARLLVDHLVAGKPKEAS